MKHTNTRPPITYLVTHFPAVSHTFIADEIDALEELGVTTNVVSINSPSAADLATDTDDRHLTTTYLKDMAKWRVAIAVATTLVCHPSLVSIPFRQGPPGVKFRLWRCFHLAEAILVFRSMRDANSRHVHAHFGQAPATIARYAAEVGRRHRHGHEYTWSVTVHGWHEFVGEREAELHDKVASAAFVACISDFTRSQLMRISSPADWTKIHVVRCGIVPDRFARRSPTAPGATARIAIVARVSPEKGHAVLIEALSVLRKRGIAVALDAVGPEAGDHGDLLRQLAVDAGVADCITWHGPQPSSQVAQILAESDIFCLPTFAEGLPVVIMEAMARGVPVVTTYISGIPELAVDEKTALIVPAARVDALAEAMERLIVDGDLRQRLVAAAAVAVAEQHDIRRNVPHLAALFNNSEKAWAP